MEAITKYTLEPELLAPTPRRLGLPGRTRLLLAAAGLLLGLFVAGSGRALWEGAKLSWLDLSGQTITGKIIAIRTKAPLKNSEKVVPSAKTAPPAQTALCYEAAVPAPHGLQMQRGWIPLGTQSPAAELESEAALPPAVQFQIGQPFPLRCASFLGITVCQPWGTRPASHIVPLFLAGGPVMAVSLLLLRRLGRWVGSRRALLRAGTATVGTITHKRTEAEDMARFFLRYGYANGGSGDAAEGRDHEEQVSAEEWREFHVGQPVTVLYDPQDPGNAALYALMKH